MKVLLAPDSFKGGFSSHELCEIMEEEIVKAAPFAIVHKFPMADGGEGTTEVLTEGLGGEYISCSAADPLERSIDAVYGIIGKTAVIEMASASGLMLLIGEDRNPLHTSTRGTGDMILDAIDRGCREIILGIGGSATNDGGMGMLTALGVKFYDSLGNELKGIGGNLIMVNEIDFSGIDRRLSDVDIVIAGDVQNPLLGELGATHVYGEQKGADFESLVLLEKGMENYINILESEIGFSVRDEKGAGAAGGLGAALIAVLGGKMVPGFDLISEKLGLEDLLASEKYDVIITGEGRIDAQTLNGKLPLGISLLARKYGAKVIGICGSSGSGYEKLDIDEIYSLQTDKMSEKYSMENAENLLRKTIYGIFKEMK